MNDKRDTPRGPSATELHDRTIRLAIERAEAKDWRPLNAIVGDGYSQPCAFCLGVLGSHAIWCARYVKPTTDGAA